MPPASASAASVTWSARTPPSQRRELRQRPLYGEHQAGIATPAQDRLHFASFDLLTENRVELREMMREWTKAAAEMTAGKMIGDVNGELLAPPDDTGEAVGLPASNLTVTFELEAGLFFICFQRDPEKQFIAIQRRLGSHDALNEGISHVGSAVFAVPPGAKPGGYVGETLLS